MNPNIIDIFVTISSFVKGYDESVDMQDIITFRDNIISKTNLVRDMIYQEHGERASFYIAFAIYSYCDEMINQVSLATHSSISSWHLLQEEVYHRNDGGDYFFEIVDSVLDNPVFPKIVAQVLYLILALGFRGCYLGAQSEIDKYKNKLSVVLPEQDVTGFDSSMQNTIDNKYKKTYKSKILKILLATSFCFAICSYGAIWFVQ